MMNSFYNGTNFFNYSFLSILKEKSLIADNLVANHFLQTICITCKSRIKRVTLIVKVKG